MKFFHEMPHQEFNDHLRSLFLALPQADWNTLAVGNFVLNRGQAWKITHVPPKRGFVLAENVLSAQIEKLLRSQYDNDDLRLTDEPTLALLRTTHKEEIEKAMAANRYQPDCPTRLPRDFHSLSCILGPKAAGHGP